MSDPYNSYGSSFPPLSQPSSPTPPRVETDPVSHLDVSAAWKRRFRLIERAGGPALPRFRELPYGDRIGLNFNMLAFFFGPFYYLAKGLWRQAILYFILAVALVMLLEVTGLGKISRAVGYGFAAVYGIRANVSYYKKVVLGEAPWL
ncbi:DUF2628 domain-containing protein [Frateuria sp. STR12]|uniref:DUF2628 domain-containing protein n=1 Tax=Frateuria hangzhouensis TaxID=2995589 RepID=UPI002260C772|nr:DUF2628 domain-containing protein [Frateuria sp. STR12]MCX7514414.1 DUF2628 domain-containing protein [Frateuria sp. STR12]